MQRITVEGRYPVWVEEIAKADTPWRDVDEIAAVLQARIRRHSGSAFIGVFDHYGLNLRVGETLPITHAGRQSDPVLPRHQAAESRVPGAVPLRHWRGRYGKPFRDFLPGRARCLPNGNPGTMG